jgi:integrase
MSLRGIEPFGPTYPGPTPRRNIVHITPATARTATLPAGKTDHVFWDDGVPGFGLRLRSSGARTWILQYDWAGKSKRITLGPTTELSVEKARKLALDRKAEVRSGRDPAGEKTAARNKAARAAAETFGALLPAYLERQRKAVAPRWLTEITRHLNVRASPLHCRPVTEIDLRELADLFEKVEKTSGPVEANHLRGAIRAFFRYLGTKGILTGNVVSSTGKAITNGKRERVLTDAELVEIWNAADGGDGAGAQQFAAIVKLLMLTGLRRDEISALRWSEVDLDAKTITLPGGRTKNGREHIVPLGPQALQILRAQPRRQLADGSQRDLIFGLSEGAGFRNHDGALNALRARIEVNRRAAGIKKEMAHWTLHDFRRSISTGLNGGMGVAPHVVECIIGHTAAKGIAGNYNFATYLFEQRAALLRWDLHLARLITGGTADKKVVPMRRA